MLLLHITIAALLSVVLLTALGNILYLRVVERTGSREEEAPLVSVLVPARNEEARIAACLEGLARQRHGRLEVIVLDDCSEDRTGDVARAFEGRVPGLRVLDGESLPPGWVGKPHACARLARGQSARRRPDWRSKNATAPCSNSSPTMPGVDQPRPSR